MTRGIGAVAAVATLAVVFAAASCGSGSGFRNAGITFMCPNAICVVKPDGSGRGVFVQAWYDGSGDPSWTRDGEALAYYVKYSDTAKIAVFSPATRRSVEFGSGLSRSSQPSWSPHASSIAVREEWGGYGLPNPDATIKILSVATNTYAAVTKPERRRFDSQPAWSPDGRTIAFVRQYFGGTSMIYLVRPDGTGARPLTRGSSPSWSPAGTRLAFTLPDSVYVIRADGSGRRRILGGLRHPRVHWSPDGQKLLFTSTHSSAFSGNAEVWTADTDGTDRRLVLRHVWLGEVAWRPGT
jgi:Tol biopolymer transport system component